MTSLTDVVLYSPDMWSNLFSRNRLDENELATRWREKAGGTFKRRDFNVALSGRKTSAYRVLRDREPGQLPIIVLPVGHCAENIDEQNLKIIGPAIATRNDIFVFRNRSAPSGSRASGNGIFRVAVREAELTTSNISRVVFRHWLPDLFFPPEGPPSSWRRGKEPRFGEVRHYEAPKPQQRMDDLLTGHAHAAVFMGSEVVKPFADERLIDAANLNRLVNNLYNIRMFPRAVYVTLADQVSSVHGLEAARQFASAVNEGIRAHSLIRKRHGALGSERRSQVPSMTGAEASLIEIEAIIKFTRDMLEDIFETDREGSRNQQARALTASDFIFYDDVAKAATLPHSHVIERIREIDIAKTFTVSMKDERAASLQTALQEVCESLDSLPPCNMNQFMSDMERLVKARFTNNRDEAQILLQLTRDFVAAERGLRNGR